MSNKKKSSPKKTTKSKKIATHQKVHPFHQLTVIFLIFLLTIALGFTFFEIIFANRIPPGISIADIPVSGLTKEQAAQKVKKFLSQRFKSPILLTYSGQGAKQIYTINLGASIPDLNIQNAVDQAFNFGKSSIFYLPGNVTLKPNPQFLTTQLKPIKEEVDQPPIDAEITLSGDVINVTPSEQGEIIDQDKLNQMIISSINTGKMQNLIIPIKSLPPNLSYNQAIRLKQRLDQIKLNGLKLVFQDQTTSPPTLKTFNLDLPTALSLLKNSSDKQLLANTVIGTQRFTLQSISLENQTLTDTTTMINQPKTLAFLQTIADQIDHPVQEPQFSYDPNTPNKIEEFSPPQAGERVNIMESYNRLNQAFFNPNQTQVELAVDTIEPKNQLSNNMGIKQLIGTGVSYFEGSIDNRIYNIGVGAKKINGILVAPGQEFSFDQTVGDITAATGYKQAYVIKSGRTVLDDGGGICQVSTTLFRAVLNAGLPVTDRTAHAYRVHYYEEGGFGPGLDATIFYPSVDFKFKNDTPAYILIQTIMDNHSLTINLYGTSDGRVSTVTNPVILSQTPPPPDLRQDDPTLPKGTVKQVDFAAWGAVTVFKRTVVRDGKTIINETYRNNYRPWQAVYLVGTK